MSAGAFIAVGFIVLLLLGGGNAVYQAVTWGYSFDRQVGDYFELADRASTACTKAQYFDKFTAALKDNGLTSGQSTIFFPKPTTDLAHNYNASISLQQRLHALCKLDPKSFEYSTGMQQITLQEFCWFPIGIFEQGYFLQHGVWGNALFPQDVSNRCATRSSK